MLKINLSRNREETVEENDSPAISAGGPEETLPPSPEAATVSDTLFLTVPEPEAPAAPEASRKTGSGKAPREKVPLSDRVPEIPEEIRAAMQAAQPPASAPEESSPVGSGRMRILALAAALVLVTGYLSWSQRDFITGLFAAKPTAKTAVHEKTKPLSEPAPARETKAAPAPAVTVADSAARPAPAAPPAAASIAPPAKAKAAPEVYTGSDPVLSALSSISGATPPRVWLISASARSDGSYELKGMSFSHEAMRSFAATLERRGTVTTRDIPAETKSPDAVYTFRLSGKLNNIKTPEILDALPANRLYALGDSLRTLRTDAGIQMVRLPRVGKAYAESELPFELEGAYSGVQKMLDGFLSNRGLIIDRLSMHPAASGKQFNRVRVSFSLRTISSL